MALLFLAAGRDPAPWRDAFAASAPDEAFRVWPDAGDPAEVEAVIAWGAEPGALARFPRLRFVTSLGAGVEHILADPTLPAGLPVLRVVDPLLTEGMAQYCVYAVLRLHRRWDLYDRAQAERRWVRYEQVPTAERRIGILGLGALGSAAGRAIAGLGFPVTGWSRTPRRVTGLETVHGPEALGPFLARTDILVCLLPHTPATAGLLDARRLALLPAGAAIVNAGRGSLIDEAALLAALESGRIGAAMLDVFATEPLPAGSPLWDHPAVTVTPHVASISEPRSIVAQILENLRRARAGEPLLNRVDPARRY